MSRPAGTLPTLKEQGMVNNSDAKTSDDNEPLVRIEEMSVEEGEAFMDDFWDEVKAKLDVHHAANVRRRQ